MPFEEVALVIVLASAGVLFVLLLWGRYAPLRIEPEAPLPAPASETPDRLALAKVGKLATAVMLAKDGWRRLPGEGDAPVEIFVRKTSGRNKFDVRIVATQCASSADTLAGYDPASMTDDAIVERVRSSTLDELSAAAIVGALRRGSVHVTKRVYVHDLTGGDSVVYTVARNGQLIERPAAKVAKVGGVPHRLMLETLATGLAHDPAPAAG